MIFINHVLPKYLTIIMLLAINMAREVYLHGLECELGLLQRADGSARVSHGKTCVTCAVYGPVEVKVSKEQCDRATIDVVIKPATGMSTPRERLLEELITSCCESTLLSKLHPHSALSITLQVENNDGGLLATMINACCLALLDACVPMATVFAAVTCGYTRSGDITSNLTLQIEEECESVLTFVTEDTTGDVITSYANGAFTIEQIQQVLGIVRESSTSITGFYKDSIRRKLSKET